MAASEPPLTRDTASCYTDSAQFTTPEAQVLNEYARMAANLDKLATLASSLASTQPALLNHLRPLERKLGLVLTLFKASVWATLQAEEARREEEELAAFEREEEEQAEQQARQRAQGRHRLRFDDDDDDDDDEDEEERDRRDTAAAYGQTLQSQAAQLPPPTRARRSVR
ncbi:uncharacterized protein L969DRAFT_90276 [Mixia osmundae IAM 14324]|uniref:DASH complex subunit DAD3 n=1 Tax=Mixia osmundae (strain CBS 9802 / IAM 14324 / JCM 22182 / KY 12970) TaxID=764103 RepID=G7DZN4_MIXOS|nr:uncharacterized protein L969DRAFT_90276 [Mixia osmundae IAM 14324]KEI37206.1 hypothetical protein L969DRAFT_90276 [Mixia osmundae IAM 14324]GAA96044.1 hypothetical protein E5Q_02705 [Mixia osmundae IAM 14324]